jgi:hypothetical protein
MKYLPYYLVHRCIIPYTYELQPKQLMLDVRSFSTDFSILDNVYACNYTSSIMFNDIVHYCDVIHRRTDNVDVNYRMPKCMQILRRFISLQSKDDTYIQNLAICNQVNRSPKNYTRHSRFIWGLLTPSERTEFINEYVLDDEIE